MRTISPAAVEMLLVLAAAIMAIGLVGCGQARQMKSQNLVLDAAHPPKEMFHVKIVPNPFGKQPAQSEESGPSPRRPSGFTLGSSGRGIPPGNANGLAKRQPGEPDSAPAARRSRLEQRLRSAARHRSDSRSEGKH